MHKSQHYWVNNQFQLGLPTCQHCGMKAWLEIADPNYDPVVHTRSYNKYAENINGVQQTQLPLPECTSLVKAEVELKTLKQDLRVLQERAAVLDRVLSNARV